MKVSRTLFTLLFTLVSVTVLGCGSDDEGGPSVQFDGAVLFGAHCVACHAADASDVDGTSAEDIAAAMANPATGMASLQNTLVTEEIEAIADYLATGTHADGWRRPGNHGHYAEDNGVTLCERCHGADLRGAGDAPSCYSCHGRKW